MKRPYINQSGGYINVTNKADIDLCDDYRFINLCENATVTSKLPKYKLIRILKKTRIGKDSCSTICYGTIFYGTNTMKEISDPIC